MSRYRSIYIDIYIDDVRVDRHDRHDIYIATSRALPNSNIIHSVRTRIDIQKLLSRARMHSSISSRELSRKNTHPATHPHHPHRPTRKQSSCSPQMVAETCRLRLRHDHASHLPRRHFAIMTCHVCMCGCSGAHDHDHPQIRTRTDRLNTRIHAHAHTNTRTVR